MHLRSPCPRTSTRCDLGDMSLAGYRVEPAVHFQLRIFSQAEIPSTLEPLLWALSVPPLILALETVSAPACLQAPDFEVPSILSALSQCLGLSQHNVASPGCLEVLGMKVLAWGSRWTVMHLERCLPDSEHHVGFSVSSWHSGLCCIGLSVGPCSYSKESFRAACLEGLHHI